MILSLQKIHPPLLRILMECAPPLTTTQDQDTGNMLSLISPGRDQDEVSNYILEFVANIQAAGTLIQVSACWTTMWSLSNWTQNTTSHTASKKARLCTLTRYIKYCIKRNLILTTVHINRHLLKMLSSLSKQTL